MTREEAQLAVATWEFPPFRCEPLRTFVMTAYPVDLVDGYHIWELSVFGPFAPSHWYHRCFETTDAWLAYYAQWQRTHGDGAARGGGEG